MKLTNTMRDAFVRAAIDDVPQVDHSEALRAAMLDAAKRHTPKEVLAFAENPDLKSWLSGEIGITLAKTSVLFWAPKHDFRSKTQEAFISKIRNDPKVKEITSKLQQQEERIGELRGRIKAVAYSATTRKALADALPEFERYLPADEAAASRSLPVVANVVSDFVKAGWPKDKASTPKPRAARTVKASARGRST